MDRDARKMLRFMKKSSFLHDGYCLFDDFYSEFCDYSGWLEQHVMACMRYLEKEGYISYCQRKATGDNVGFELEHKAYHSFYFRLKPVCVFLVKSVIVPIIVAAITAIVTLFLNGRLSH